MKLVYVAICNEVAFVNRSHVCPCKLSWDKIRSYIHIALSSHMCSNHKKKKNLVFCSYGNNDSNNSAC